MRKFIFVLTMVVAASLATGCLSTRKFTRNEVKTASDTLNARIDTTDSAVKEANDGVKRVDERVTQVDGKVTAVDGKVTTVDGKVTALDTKTTQGLATVNGAVQSVDQKATRATSQIASLDQQFQKRNQYTVASEKAILFKFDSAVVDAQYTQVLEEIAAMLQQDPDAVLVLEGRTDSSGNDEYNIRLGERRVEAVKRMLTVDMGIPIYRLHNISFGAARPIADNTSRDGREKNRAVVLTVLKPATEGTAAPVTTSSQQ